MSNELWLYMQVIELMKVQQIQHETVDQSLVTSVID